VFAAPLLLALSRVLKHVPMPGNDPIGEGDNLASAFFKFGLAPCERIVLRRHIREPPEVGQDINAFTGLHHQRGILFGMAGGAQDFDARRHLVAVPMVAPQITLVHAPKVPDFGVREQGDVHGVVWMMVANKHMGDILRGNPCFCERVQNKGSIGDHARVSHYNRMIALDKGDSTGHASGTIIRRAGDELRPSMA